VLIELFWLDVTVESLRANIDRKSSISLQRGHFDPKFQIERVVLPIILTQIVRPDKPYNFVADSYHTKTLCSRFSSSEERPFCVFETPLGA